MLLNCAVAEDSWVPWTTRRSSQSILKEIQSWIFIGRTDAEAETAILWPSDGKNWLTGKDPDVGKDWGWEKRTTEDQMVGWHHRRDGRQLKYSLGVGDGQGSLECYSPWGSRVRYDRASFDVLSPWFLLQKLLWSLAPPLPLQSSPLELSKRLSSGLKSSESLPNKTQVTTFRLFFVFLVNKPK